MKRKIALTYSHLKTLSFCYLMLPLLIFLAFFLRPGFAILSCAALLFCTVWSVRSKDTDHEPLVLSGYELALILFLALLWSFFGGQGGFYFQSYDWNERNAIFRDLILSSWPVYYKATNTALAYYIGYWLPAAFGGRLVYILSGSGNAAWRIGNILMWLWTTAGITLVFLLFLRITNADSARKRRTAILIFIFFSGLDIVGTRLANWTYDDYMTKLHLEWWSKVAQFSSTTTCLFFVFNQAVPAWLAMLCLLHENRNPESVQIRNYGFLLVSTLLCSPFPCVGLGIYMLAAMIRSAAVCREQGQISPWMKSCFSPSNIGMVVFVLPFPAAYLFSNAVLGSVFTVVKALPTSVIAAGIAGVFAAIVVLFVCIRYRVWLSLPRGRSLLASRYALPLLIIGVTAAALILYFTADQVIPLFLVLEAGLYLLLLLPFCQDDYYYYLTYVILLICPFVAIGSGGDFCMRASIPSILLTAVYVIRTLIASDTAERKPSFAWCKKVIIVLLIVGLCTPAMEFFRGIYLHDRREDYSDQVKTLNQLTPRGNLYRNFVHDCREASFFFSYLAPPEKTEPDTE